VLDQLTSLTGSQTSEMPNERPGKMGTPIEAQHPQPRRSTARSRKNETLRDCATAGDSRIYFETRSKQYIQEAMLANPRRLSTLGSRPM